MKTTRKRTFVMVALVLVMLLLIVCVSCCVLDNQSTFNGSRVRNPDCYTIDFTLMNQTDNFVMSFKEGDTIHVSYEITKGTVDLLIGMDSENPIYRGNSITSGDFTVGISKTGSYTVTVQAKRAAGKLKVELKK